MDINSRIRVLRKELGLKQYEFADSIGLKNGAISWMEKSGNTVTEQNIEIICAKFNVNKKWLLTGEGTMFTEEKEKTDLVEWATRLAYEGDTFAHRLAVTLSRLNEEQLEMLANIVEQLAAPDKEKIDLINYKDETSVLIEKLKADGLLVAERKTSGTDG